MSTEKIVLWPDAKCAGTGDAKDDFQPWMDVYLTKSVEPRGAVLICPGGAYTHRAPHEGFNVAVKFNELGFHAFVVQYRVAPYRFPAPQQDALRSLKIIRANADKWNVKADKIAVCGFSAGGHLAASTGTVFDQINADAGDAADQYSNRPDALILCYPVISSGSKAHRGSFQQLLGEKSSEQEQATLSLEKRVSGATPPTFLWHTAADPGVPVENSLFFAQALQDNKVPFELHIFPHGRHGLGLADELPNVATWPALCATWLKNMGW
ncbi:MAG: alpha/beta hydrolase [Victivallaceae bacterium]